jgi:hypothetical protein
LGKEPVNGELEIHFLDVGQADCTLIRCDGYTMLVDTGVDDQGTKIQNYLRKQGIERLDYLVLTHSDADHIGSADVILTKFEIGTIFMSDFEKDTKYCGEMLRCSNGDDCGDRVRCYSVAATGKTEFFFCGCFDIDGIGFNTKNTCQIVPHGVNVRCELRSLSNDGRVDVVDAVTAFFQQRMDMCGKDETVGTSVFGIGIREMSADVTKGCRTEQSIHDRMGQHVRIGMTEQSAFKRNVNTAQNQLSVLNKSVYIITVTNSEYLHKEPHFCMSYALFSQVYHIFLKFSILFTEDLRFQAKKMKEFS